MRNKLKEFANSFKHAFNGIFHSFHEQRNIKIMLIIGLAVILLAYLLNIKKHELIIVVFICFFVIILEMINTSIERTIDAISNGETKRKYGVAKDILAGAVLMATILSIIAGLLIFIPYIIDFLQFSF
ncbi:MAG: diacylglycerol kinase family protein [Patescibacteria group bacterium]